MNVAELNRLFEDALASEAAWQAVEGGDPAHLAQYDLTAEELAALEAPDPGSLAAIGVHPMLAMWGSLMRNPGFAAQMSAGEYFTRSAEEVA